LRGFFERVRYMVSLLRLPCRAAREDVPLDEGAG
jgi:hypothetical protein